MGEKKEGKQLKKTFKETPFIPSCMSQLHSFTTLLSIPPSSLGAVMGSVGGWVQGVMVYFFHSLLLTNFPPLILASYCSPALVWVLQRRCNFFPWLHHQLFPHSIPFHVSPLCLPMYVYRPFWKKLEQRHFQVLSQPNTQLKTLQQFEYPSITQSNILLSMGLSPSLLEQQDWAIGYQVPPSADPRALLPCTGP